MIAQKTTTTTTHEGHAKGAGVAAALSPYLASLSVCLFGFSDYTEVGTGVVCGLF